MSDIVVKDLPFSKESKNGTYRVYQGDGMIIYVKKSDMPNPAQKIRVTVEPA